jgi:hypothetical protein
MGIKVSYNVIFSALVTVSIFRRVAFAQSTAAPSTGLMTVDYIIIGVTSAAAAGCLALLLYVVISNSLKKKNASKVSNLPDEIDRRSIVSKGSSKSSRSADNHGFDKHSERGDGASRKLNDD